MPFECSCRSRIYCYVNLLYVVSLTVISIECYLLGTMQLQHENCNMHIFFTVSAIGNEIKCLEVLGSY